MVTYYRVATSLFVVQMESGMISQDALVRDNFTASKSKQRVEVKKLVDLKGGNKLGGW